MTEMNLKNLRQRPGGSWAVVFYVPQELQPKIGKREIVRGLGTSDRQEAMRRKTSALLAISAEVHALASDGEEWSTANLTREALAFSQERQKAPRDPEFADYVHGLDEQIPRPG